jgi:hypothetical protein
MTARIPQMEYVQIDQLGKQELDQILYDHFQSGEQAQTNYTYKGTSYILSPVIN